METDLAQQDSILQSERRRAQFVFNTTLERFILRAKRTAEMMKARGKLEAVLGDQDCENQLGGALCAFARASSGALLLSRRVVRVLARLNGPRALSRLCLTRSVCIALLYIITRELTFI